MKKLCEIIDDSIFTVLNDNDALDNYLNGFEINDNRRYKKYQVIILDKLNIGLITSEQKYIIAVFDDTKKTLGRFIAENRIVPQTVGGKEVAEYKTIDIWFIPPKNNYEVHRSLGKLFAFSIGKKIEDGKEAHHKLHAMINMTDTVKVVEKSINAGLYQEFDNGESIDYIKTRILKSNNSDFELFMSNIKYVTSKFDKYRGIYIYNSDLIKDCIDIDNIKLSRF